eukprot:scaffold261_cov170-Amphora_coffeaeformis.AAC.28
MRLPISVKRGIQKLLRRSIAPAIQVRSSKVKGAGLGVFATQPIAKEATVCLYPGIFSPGLPRALSDATYFGNTSLPSGVDPPEMNAYILNLKSTCGYLDGIATEGMVDNPAACAQIVNHNRQHPNVHVVSFWWHDVLDDMTLPSSSSTTTSSSSVDTDNAFYPIPNRRRCDGAPWFFHNDEMMYYEKHVRTPCAGAVLCAARDLEIEEMYLDYGLQQPLPSWARGWYDMGT